MSPASHQGLRLKTQKWIQMARKFGNSTLNVVARNEWKSTPELIFPSSCSHCALQTSAVCPASQGHLAVRSPFYTNSPWLLFFAV